MKNKDSLKTIEMACTVGLLAGVAGLIVAIYRKENSMPKGNETAEMHKKRAIKLMGVSGALALGAFVGIQVVKAKMKS